MVVDKRRMQRLATDIRPQLRKESISMPFNRRGKQSQRVEGPLATGRVAWYPSRTQNLHFFLLPAQGVDGRDSWQV